MEVPPGSEGAIVTTTDGSSVSTLTVKTQNITCASNSTQTAILVPLPLAGVSLEVTTSATKAQSILVTGVTAEAMRGVYYTSGVTGSVTITGAGTSGADPLYTSSVLTGSSAAYGTALPAEMIAVGYRGNDGTLRSPTTLISGVQSPIGQGANYGLQNDSLVRHADGQGNWEPALNNTQGTLLASAARTATTNSPTQTKYNGSALVIFVNVTVASGTGGITPKISVIDPASGSSFDIWAASAAITTTGLNVYEVFPAAVTANNLVVPRTWGFTMSASDSSSYTYSAGFASDS
ncbi:MAG: hypothetical protein ACYCSN_15490 [Acidobacteriaceae bacterium]